jgi:very-short-patch-repair endonuclease
MFLKYNSKLKSFSRNLRKKQTESEIKFYKILRTFFRDFRFLKQKPIDNFIVDFYCAKLNLVIEIDGSIHDSYGEKDQERDSILLHKYKLNTIRFSNSDIENRQLIKERLKNYIVIFNKS